MFFLLSFVPGAKEDEDVDYQGLETEKRAISMFICPSCNENSDYQRLSRPGHCLHERNSEGREKSASFYESLTPERGMRESFYASPSCDGGVRRIFLFQYKMEPLSRQSHFILPEQKFKAQAFLM